MKNINEKQKKKQGITPVLMRFLFVLLFSIQQLFTLNVYGQTLSVNGTVSDDQGPLPGASVIIKGTNNGTTTDFDGNFSINASSSDVLVISYVGFLSQEVLIEGRNTLNLVLTESATALDEMIVIGYGSVKKGDLTGSVQSVRADDLNLEGVSSFNQLLQGVTAGVQVNSAGSEPGGAVSVSIRGPNSINAGVSPLYVIDGFPMDNRDIAGTIGRGISNKNARNPLAALNPNDIENIEILKDASATAIYGSRGANGVILITTKKGKSGEAKVTYSSNIGIQSNVRKWDLLSPQEYTKSINEIQAAGGALVSERVDVINDGGRDYQDLVLNDMAMVEDHNLSVSGGTDKTNYFMSFNYFDQSGVIKTSSMKRYSTRINITSKVSDKLTLNMNLSPSYIQDREVNDGWGTANDAGIMYSVLTWDPTAPVFNLDGTTYYDHPMLQHDSPLEMLDGITTYSNRYRIFGSGSAEYSILPELTAKLNVGGDMNYRRRDTYAARSTKTGAAAGGIAGVYNYLQTNYLTEGLLTYNKTKGDHFLNILAGVSSQKFITEGTDTEGEGFISDVLFTYNMGGSAADRRFINSSKEESLLTSYLTRLNYSYKDKYIITYSSRFDGSSKFGKNNKFSHFPSFALAWKLGQENFVKENFTFINSLKLRGSWGETGNENIGNYNSLVTYGGGSRGWGRPAYYLINGSLQNSVFPDRIANPNLKWETTQQTNIGLDYGLFSNRINGSIDYFYKKTVDMLLDLPIPTSTGFGSVLSNVGSVMNSGLEIGLRSKNLVNNNFKWNTSFNISTLKNEVLDLGEVPRIIGLYEAGGARDLVIIKKGNPIYSFFGYEVEGVWQANDDFSLTNDAVSPGDYKYKDQNGDKIVNSEDKVILGSSIPKVIWNLNNNFSSGKFELDILLEGVNGSKMYNANLAESIYPNNFRQSRLAAPVLNRWTPSNPTNEYHSFVNSAGQGSKQLNSQTIEDASYIKLSNVRLTYNFEIENSLISSASAFISGSNLWINSKYSGLDPSINPNGPAALKIDFVASPSFSLLTLGVNINF